MEQREDKDKDKDKENRDKKDKGIRHKHGEYKNVLLTDEQLEKLKTEYPDWPERIDRLSEYMESKGAAYKNHYATIKAWARKDPPKPASRVTVLSD